MLRNKSRRAVTSKETLMADHSSPLPSPNPTQNQTIKPISSFLTSPRFFNGFLARTTLSSSDHTETGISPNSILDSKQIFNLGNNPFGYDRSSTNPVASLEKKSSIDKESEGIGLALLDSEKPSNCSSNAYNRMVLLGSKLKIQIPVQSSSPSSDFGSKIQTPAQISNPTSDFGFKIEIPVQNSNPTSIFCSETPNSPSDFGIKTRSPHMATFTTQFSKEEVKDSLSLMEMESSEDYTCVIIHGPNPKTTHIFDNCIVESCCGVGKLSELMTENDRPTGDSDSSAGAFLSFCKTCKVDLAGGKDIYMYRGERAFCSHECRCQEMVLEEGQGKE